MPASETKIPVSKDTRRALRHVKAHEERHTYDDAIGVLLDAYGGTPKGET